MRFEHVNRYSADAQRVLAMLTDSAFRERVCERQHAVEHAVQVTEAGEGTVVLITRSQSMAGAPAVAVKMTGDTVRIVQRETWTSADAAEFAMEIPGKPGRMSGTISLRDTGEGCEETFRGEVKVGIPLVGGKLEQLVANLLTDALEREAEVGRDWLSST